MAQFITRVELHGSPPITVYDQLHALMEAAGFRRTIQGSDGLWYKMPSAMYVTFGDLTAATVRDLARSVASKTGIRNWVLTARAEDIAWFTELVPVNSNPLQSSGRGIINTLLGERP
jgi:hypothetical protein